jgi:hypothetical protein
VEVEQGAEHGASHSTRRPRIPSSISWWGSWAHAEEIMRALSADGYAPVRIETKAAIE